MSTDKIHVSTDLLIAEIQAELGQALNSFKPRDPRRDLIRAAALIVAEIERLDRVSAKESGRQMAQGIAGILLALITALVVASFGNDIGVRELRIGGICLAGHCR